jgi:cell division protein FtsB
MTLKQNFADQLKAQSDIWKAQVKDYQEKVEQASEQARSEYK